MEQLSAKTSIVVATKVVTVQKRVGMISWASAFYSSIVTKNWWRYGKTWRTIGDNLALESRAFEVDQKLLDKPLLQLEGYLRLVVSN